MFQRTWCSSLLTGSVFNQDFDMRGPVSDENQNVEVLKLWSEWFCGRPWLRFFSKGVFQGFPDVCGSRLKTSVAASRGYLGMQE